jgi:predicted AAA+ superfamily ATPase
MVGRKSEKAIIESLLKSQKSEFLAVTGRRRVGKTYLIDTLLGDYYCFSMTGIQNAKTSAQLVNFGIKLSDYTNVSCSPKDWQEAFHQLKIYLRKLDKEKKQVIFIDELPWIATARSGFVQMLAHFWNDYLSKQDNFILVICGSATSWITQKIINDKGGLHNRVSEIIHLYPFSISETNDFLKSKGLHFTNQEITRIYMALGGIPFYLDKLNKGESFAAAVKRICFSKSGILRNEYDNLYKALFNNASLHEKIVDILAQNTTGLSRNTILKALAMKSSGSYQRAIDELVVSDFIIETSPFGKRKRDSLYRLIDEFSIFYHHFMKQNNKFNPGYWQQKVASQSYKIWAGYAFESFCYRHIKEIKKVLGISGVYTEVSRLNVPTSGEVKGFQIDLIIDRKDDTINLCEIKFYASKFTIDKKYYEALIEKRQRFITYTKTRKQVFLTFITNHGLHANKYADEIVDAEISLEEIMSN